MKVAVVLGGTSAERDVSLATGLAVARAVRSLNFPVTAVDCAYGDRVIADLDDEACAVISESPSGIENRRRELDGNLFKTIAFLKSGGFDVVFNALHGGYGENGQFQALLEVAGIPFTGSGSLASGIGMHKHFCKILFRDGQIPTADWHYLQNGAEPTLDLMDALNLPVVVKPNEQGSTVGLTIVKNRSQILEAVHLAYRHSKSVIIENYIAGRELTVGVLLNKALPVIEIIPESGFYDYESKYQSGKTRYEVPANIPDDLTGELQETALKAYHALGCRDYARVDFRLQPDGCYFCLEVNTLPGMTSTSLVPKAAAATGISFEELVERILTSAIERSRG